MSLGAALASGFSGAGWGLTEHLHLHSHNATFSINVRH